MQISQTAPNYRSKIRVIKQNQKETPIKSEPRTKSSEKDRRDASRQLSTTVAGWVREFKEKQDMSPRYAFAALFR